VARPIHCLSAVALDRLAKKPGMHSDGGGLYLCVHSATQCSWVFRFMRASRARTMGLGAYPAVSLAKAREEAAKARAMKAEGKDPIVERDAIRAAQRLADAKAKSFDQCRDEYIALNRAGWKNIKHASQWRNTLTTYVTSVFDKVLVRDVDVALVLKVLAPLWSTKPETAGRVRGRIETVLDYAGAIGLRIGENPARWRGNLKMLLPSRAKVR
jgi:hypothetical protein